MTRISSRSTRRSAFTLVELLVVIAIIALLVSLTAAAVMRVMVMIPEVQTRTEISQLDASLASFMSDYNLDVPPPSYLILREDLAYNATNPLEMQSYTFLKRAFGKNLGVGQTFIDWNGDGVPSGRQILEGEQCLVFYLGGIQSMAGGTPACLGFSTNSANPAMAGGSRKGPYMTFQSSRLMPLASVPNLTVASTSPFFVYIDAWNNKVSPKPYAYFSSYGLNNQYDVYTSTVGGDCASIGALPYYLGISGTTINYVNPNKYQIISAGKGIASNPPAFGGGLWGGGAAAMGPGADDQANFSSRVLGADAQ
jgi:general secretion pathway protein G